MKDSIDLAFLNATRNTAGAPQYLLWNATLVEDPGVRLPPPGLNQADRDLNIQLSPDRALAIVVPNHMRRMLDTRLYEAAVQAVYDELNAIMGQHNASRIMISCFTQEVIDEFNGERLQHGKTAIKPRVPETVSATDES